MLKSRSGNKRSSIISKQTVPVLNNAKGHITGTEAAEKAASGKEYAKVVSLVRDFIFESHRLPQVNDIVEITGIQKTRCNEIVEQLVRQKQLYVAFDGEGLPKVILPYDMMQGALMMQKKPAWITAYGFAQKAEIAGRVEQLTKEMTGYEQLERLLYAADIPLEEAIAHGLELLGFENVHHYKDDSDNPDVTFENGGTKGIVEVEGTTKAGDKRKILQINGWLQREIDAGKTASQIKGFFALNHYRDIEPSKREYPLTTHAKEFLELYHYTYFTTPFLFDIVKKVKGGTLTKEEGRSLIWQGDELA